MYVFAFIFFLTFHSFRCLSVPFRQDEILCNIWRLVLSEEGTRIFASFYAVVSCNNVQQWSEFLSNAFSASSIVDHYSHITQRKKRINTTNAKKDVAERKIYSILKSVKNANSRYEYNKFHSNNFNCLVAANKNWHCTTVSKSI